MRTHLAEPPCCLPKSVFLLHASGHEIWWCLYRNICLNICVEIQMASNSFCYQTFKDLFFVCKLLQENELRATKFLLIAVPSIQSLRICFQHMNSSHLSSVSLNRMILIRHRSLNCLAFLKASTMHSPTMWLKSTNLLVWTDFFINLTKGYLFCLRNSFQRRQTLLVFCRAYNC